MTRPSISPEPGTLKGTGVFGQSPWRTSVALARADCPDALVAMKVKVHAAGCRVVAGPILEPKPPLHWAGAGLGWPKRGGSTRTEQVVAPVLMNLAPNGPPSLGSTEGANWIWAVGAGEVVDAGAWAEAPVANRHGITTAAAAQDATDFVPMRSMWGSTPTPLQSRPPGNRHDGMAACRQVSLNCAPRGGAALDQCALP